MNKKTKFRFNFLHKFLILNVLIFLFFFKTSFSQLSSIKNFLPKDYKAGSQNWSGIQDNNGMIILGNGMGVMIYDGQKWDIIETPNTVRSLCVDAENKIFIGLDGDMGFLEKSKNGILSYVSLKNKIPEANKTFADVWSIIYYNNEVYFNTLDNIFIYQKDTFEIIKPTTAKFFKGMSVINNKLYVSEPARGLEIINNHKVEFVNGSDSLAKKIYCILDYDDENLLIGTRTDGLFLYSPTKFVSKPTKFSKIDSILTTDKLYNGIKIDDNHYCFTTVRNGIVLMDKDGNIEKQYNLDNGLIDNTCFDLFKDSNQQIWICSANGISLIYNNLPFNFSTTVNGLDGFVASINYVNNKLYVCTDKNLYVQNNDLSFTTIANTNGQNYTTVFNNNNLYVVNQDNGIMTVENNEAKPLINCNIVRPIYMYPINNSTNEIWISSSDASNIERGQIIDNKYIRKGIIKGIDNKAYNIQLDTIDKILWFTNSPQLYKAQLDNNYDSAISVITCDTTMGLPSDAATPFKLDNEIIFATQKGIYKYNKITNKFEYDSLYSLLKGKIYYSPPVMGKNKNIWFEEYLTNGKSEKGYLKYNNGNYEIIKTPFYKFAASISSHYFCINAQIDSVIYFGTSDGLITYYPYKQVNYDLSFNTIIRKISSKDTLIYYGEILTNSNKTIPVFDYKNNNIIFEYTCTFYEDAEKNMYRYRLIGSETAWSDWVLDIKKEYTLREGKYCFEVQSKNVYEKLGQIASYSFKISPPWYRTWFAYFIYIILIFLFIALLIKIFTRRLIKQKEKLEQIVVERTTEIRQQKEEITVQNENLLQQKEEIQAQAEELLDKNNLIETAYNNVQLLSEIGKEVTSSLDIKTIISTVYDNVNTLMDASVFAIGIYNAEKQRIEFDGTKEKGETLEFHFDEISNKNQFSITCFNTQKEIIIQDLYNEFNKYFADMPVPTEGDIPKSLIYLPIFSKEKTIGVITVQSFNANVYTDFQVNILQNIAIYTAIALENADSYRLISDKNQIIEYQNEAIKGSIRYAQTIQNAILPIKEEINKHFENFIVFRPKDIVSGDFYWYTEIIRNYELGIRNEKEIMNYELGIMNEKNISDDSIHNSKFIIHNSKIHNSFLIGVFDCTGHGVPGAFMSMIGNTLINEIVNSKHIFETNEILTNLHKLIVISLRQNESENNDGMDVCLCRIDKYADKTIINFTGAKRPLLVYKQGFTEIETIKGNRKSIGGTQKKLNQEEFVSNQIIFETEGIIFLSSDGYTDQNNPERKKFGSNQLTNIIFENKHKSMQAQGEIYNKAIVDWMNGDEQRDDITLIGIKI